MPRRLNAAPARAEDVAALPVPPPRVCLECGADLSGHGPDADFCCTPHRMAFNNRRAKRGTELYDLFMALRYDRGVATQMRIFTELSRKAADYRREDVAEREGRRSWRGPAAILARRAQLAGGAEAVRLGPAQRRRGRGDATPS